jgi:hypothetical protein
LDQELELGVALTRQITEVQATDQGPPSAEEGSGQQPHVTLLRFLLAASIASTAIHYTHNFVMASMYPPLLTGLALWGYAKYVAGNLRAAGRAFIAYSYLGISTIGHFLGPTPDIPPFFFVTIFTDFLTGTAMLVFGIMTLRRAGERSDGAVLAPPFGT